MYTGLYAGNCVQILVVDLYATPIIMCYLLSLNDGCDNFLRMHAFIEARSRNIIDICAYWNTHHKLRQLQTVFSENILTYKYYSY